MPDYEFPIARPVLPDAEALMPYLQSIDASHHYTNFGPLETRLGDTLCGHLGGSARENLAMVSNGTLALQLTISLFAHPGRKHCLIPSWAFRAVPEAALCAGFTPYFVDVDTEAASMCPDAAEEEIRRLGADNVGAIILVPFMGKSIDLEPWRRLREAHGIPILMDAAAGFCNHRCSDIPTTMSFHATKIFSTGEGGCVLYDGDLTRLTEETSFGALDRPRGTLRATNAKLSEYHAAIGLASLDEWEGRLTQYRRLAACYVEALSARSSSDIEPEPGYSDRWMSNSMPIRVHEDRRQDVIATLHDAGVETRMWWGTGLHRQPRYADLPSGPLPNTEAIARRSLSLPFYFGMKKDNVIKISEYLA